MGSRGSTCLQPLSTLSKQHMSAKHQLWHQNPPRPCFWEFGCYPCSSTSFRLLSQQTVLGGLSTPPDLSCALSTACRMGILQAKEELGNISHTRDPAVVMREDSDIRMLSSNLSLAPSYQDSGSRSPTCTMGALPSQRTQQSTCAESQSGQGGLQDHHSHSSHSTLWTIPREPHRLVSVPSF